MFRLDVCGVHVSGLVVFVAAMGRWGWMFGASTAFVLFMECLG